MLKIKKSNGQLENFDQQKLRNSLKRSGASLVLANEIVDNIKKTMTDGVSTGIIYKEALNVLNKKSKKAAQRYSIRRRLAELGPTGFPFEKYIASIMSKKGYKTKVGIILSGKCIDHEIDIVAYDKDDLILIEAKYHNEISKKTDTKVALYISARFSDLREQDFLINNKKRKMTDGLLITNTKFTDNVKKYAKCSNLNLISWDYPEKGNLYELIESTGVFPDKKNFDLPKLY